MRPAARTTRNLDLLENLGHEDRAQVDGFIRFLDSLEGQPKIGSGHVVMLDPWWYDYAMGGPVPPRLWEGDYS